MEVPTEMEEGEEVDEDDKKNDESYSSEYGEDDEDDEDEEAVSRKATNEQALRSGNINVSHASIMPDYLVVTDPRVTLLRCAFRRPCAERWKASAPGKYSR